MLQRGIRELAVGALLGSPEVANALQKELERATTDRDGIDLSKLSEHCQTCVQEALDRAWPRRFRLNELAHVGRLVCGVNIFQTDELSVLDQLYDELMWSNGDYIEYRDRQVQAYAQLVTEIDPALLVAWGFAKWINGIEQPRIHDVQRVVNCQRPMFAPITSPHRPVADNHVHLGGIDQASVIIAALILDESVPNLRATEEQERLLRVRKILHAVIENNWYNQGEVGLLHQRLGLILRAHTDTTLDGQAIRTTWYSFSQSYRPSKSPDASYLLHQLAESMQRSSYQAAWLWLGMFLWHLYQASKTPPWLRVAIMLVFCDMTILRRQLVMDGQGLRRFVHEYFSSKLRRNGKGSAQGLADRMACLLTAHADVAEIKVSSDKVNARFIQNITSAVATHMGASNPRDQHDSHLRHVGPTSAEQVYVESLRRWHLCVHFSRGKSPGEKELRKAGLGKSQTREFRWLEAKKLMEAIDNSSKWSAPALLDGHGQVHFKLTHRDLVRGLDVAGDETAGPIEWFAPQLRWLRKGLARRELGAAASPALHFSIHAGEDYAHPLSGLRHIDETVRFCEFKSGDRLGHALALGTNPKKWLSRHRDVLLPLDEHLDNLVWAWHQACELAPHLNLAARVLPNLERRIARFAPLASWLNASPAQALMFGHEQVATHQRPVPGTLLPDTLFRAWLLRRNCPTGLSISPFLHEFPRYRLASPDLMQLGQLEQGTANDEARVLYERRARNESLQSNRHPKLVLLACVTSAGEGARGEHHFLSADWQQLQDHDTPEEIDFMEAIQDHLLDQYERRGICIETNPTSNVYIARLEGYAEHPIFRWNPPTTDKLAPQAEFNRFGLRRGPIAVLINTDDPGIMPTTLRMEYELIREAAIDLGYGRSCVDDWIEKIRCAGLDHFHRNHLPVFSGVTP